MLTLDTALFKKHLVLFSSSIIGFIDLEACPTQFRQSGSLNTHREEIGRLEQIGLWLLLSSCVRILAVTQYPMILARPTDQYDKCEQTCYNKKTVARYGRMHYCGRVRKQESASRGKTNPSNRLLLMTSLSLIFSPCAPINSVTQQN